MNINREEQRVLHALAQGGCIKHLRDQKGKIYTVDGVTRDGWLIGDCTLEVFKSLKAKRLIASNGGRPYGITRKGLAAVRAQFDNR